MRIDVTSSDRDQPKAGRTFLEDPGQLAEALVAGSIRKPWLVVAVALVLTLVGLYVTITRFAITTQTDQLIQSDAAWIKDKDAVQAAFPQLETPILAVVDASTPELADSSAARLAAALASAPGSAIRKVWRPDGGPFFDRNGLLFLPVEELRTTTAGLLQQQPTLLALSGDPSLRGLMRLVQIGASRGALGENAGLLGQITDVVDDVLAGKPARMSWQALMSGKPATPAALRRFLLIEPVLDYDELEPASAATTKIRSAAAGLGLTPQAGVRVRLTGAAPLADEEFATVRDGAPLHLGLTIVAIAVILYLALKSGRVILAVLLTTLVGLVLTIGVGLLMVGRFNVISVAVAALFLGLGVDFGIQFAVRYRDERFKLDDVRGALRSAGRGIGWSLTLAAASLLAGFFAFLPTSFKGVSELGLITGVGMIIAFLASLTFLPALIALLKPRGEMEDVEIRWLAAVDHWIHAHRRLVIVASSLIVLAGLPFLFKLEFDANPMHLRDEKTEGVATFLDLTRQPGSSPNTISVLAPSLGAAQELAARLAKLPEVSRTVTLNTFIPENQDEKRAIIEPVAARFPALTTPRDPAPAPTDAELVETVRSAAEALRGKAGEAGAAGEPSRRLATTLGRLADASPERRAAAQAAVAGDLPALLGRVGSLLQPETVTLASLPASLREDWLAKDGQARIEVLPSGDANDNAVLESFASAVRAVAPNVSGAPIDVVESRKIIVRAFVMAGIFALIAIFIILTIALRRPKDVALTLGPLVIATALTLEAAYLIGMPLNLANIIALPLMLAVGVNFHIYYMIAWRNGVADMLASSLTRAIWYSSLTTGVAFGSLWLSNHPGTASMGKLLTLSLFFTLLAAFIIVPAYLGPPRAPAPQQPVNG